MERTTAQMDLMSWNSSVQSDPAHRASSIVLIIDASLHRSSAMARMTVEISQMKHLASVMIIPWSSSALAAHALTGSFSAILYPTALMLVMR